MPNEDRIFRIAIRQALLMMVDAIERLENSIAKREGEKLPYPIRTSELKKLLKSQSICDMMTLE